MKTTILKFGKALSKTEQKSINGGTGANCPDPFGQPFGATQACTTDNDCHNVIFQAIANCSFGCCVTIS